MRRSISGVILVGGRDGGNWIGIKGGEVQGPKLERVKKKGSVVELDTRPPCQRSGEGAGRVRAGRLPME